MLAEDKILWIACVAVVFISLMALTYLKKGNVDDFKRPLSWFLFFTICGLIVFL